MKLNPSSLFLFLLASFAPLPIFFDLKNFSIIFTENVFLMTNKPQIPLPISFVFFAFICIINFPSILNKISYKKFYLLSALISCLSLLIVVNQIPITRLFQLILPLFLILSLPAIIQSSNKYNVCAFPISLSLFSINHLFYNFTNISNVDCSYNCNFLFYGYEIYHASVGFPEVVLIGVASALFISQIISGRLKKIFFVSLAFLLVFYAFFIGRGATAVSLILSIITFGFTVFIKLIFTERINKYILIILLISIIFAFWFNEPIMDKFELVYSKITAVQELSPRIFLWTNYFKYFAENPLSIIFGGVRTTIGGHNSILSALTLVGLVGLGLLIKSYMIAFGQFNRYINFKKLKLTDVQIYSLNLFFITVAVGNFINDSITQPFNTIAIFMLLIIILSTLKDIKRFY